MHPISTILCPSLTDNPVVSVSNITSFILYNFFQNFFYTYLNKFIGKIIFNNKDLVKSNDEEKTTLRKNDIAIVYQNNNLISDLSAIENIALAYLNKSNDKNKSYLLAEKLLKEFGLSNRMNHYPYQMSGGEQQRVAIARAIINNPKLLFADEPTGNLDHKNTNMILNYLFKLKKNNRLVIIATHNRDLAQKTDLRLTLSDGNVKVDS